LKYGLRALGLQPEDSVLCPDYTCHTLVEVFEGAQMRVRFHSLTEGLTPDWSALEAVPPAAARALVMIHYFGVPQDVARYRRLCDQRGWLLLEDNAHGHGGAVAGRPLGTFGDLGIASPYKSFPIRNGGLLYLPAGVRFDPPDLPCQPGRASARLARSLLRRALDLAPALRARLRECPPYASPSAFRDDVVGEWAMDQWSYDQVMRADLPAVRSVRQRLYHTWQAWTSRHGLVALLPRLDPGAMPLLYPARSSSPDESARWFLWGHRHGIDVHSWPTLPEAVVGEGGAALRRWERTVCFPLHQEIDPLALEARLTRIGAPKAAIAGA
jgi:hypothetical protein